MKCAWQQLVRILPGWLGKEAEQYRDGLLELRLRCGAPPEFVCRNGPNWLYREITREDIDFCINTASNYSPWAARSLGCGYITAPGGHRIGLCGDAVFQGGVMSGIKNVSSLNIRIARDFSGIAGEASKLPGSILLLGPPGSGKTTLLRDLARRIARTETVSVVDERGELFPTGFERGKRMDVLIGCSKTVGIETVLRVMGPDCIAVDEITAEADCAALMQAGWCGIRLLATAHAETAADLYSRRIYRPLAEVKLFDHILVLNRDKSWKLERMKR